MYRTGKSEAGEPVGRSEAGGAVVHGQPGVRIGDRRDVRDAPLVAEPILLPSGLVDVRRAAARRTGPRSLAPSPLVVVAHERSAADRGHELGRAGIAYAPGQDEAVPIAVVARRDGDRHAAVVVVALEQLLAGELAAAAVAVRDGVGSERDGSVDAGTEVEEGRAVGFDQQDLAARTGRRHCVEVERDLEAPTGIRRG